MAEEITYDALFDGVMEIISGTVSNVNDAVVLRDIVKRSSFAIRREYADLNKYAKDTYMVDGTTRLDRHKTGACFMIAFMKRLVIASDRAQYEKYREKVAMIAGLSVMGTILTHADNHNYKNAGIISHITKHNGFKLPPPLCDDTEAYGKCWALELRGAYRAETKDGKRGFSIISLANELFLIESYNRELAKPSEA